MSSDSTRSWRRRAGRPAWIAAAVVAAAAGIAGVAGCGRGAAGGPCLLVLTGDGDPRLVAVPVAGGPARDVLPDVPGRVVDALALARGTAALVAIEPPGGGGRALWRIDAGAAAAPPRHVFDGPPTLTLQAASRDGALVLVGHGLLLHLDGAPRLEDLDAPGAEVVGAGDLSEDGGHVVVAFGAGCARDDAACRLEIWGFDRAAPDRGWQVVARDATRSVDAPWFVPGTAGARLGYRRAVLDPACPGPRGCGAADLMEVGFATPATRVTEAGVTSARPSPDGRQVAAVGDGHLVVGKPGVALAPIADGAVAVVGWSPDRRWLGFAGADHHVVAIRADGGGRRDLGAGRGVAWLARLPTGARPAP
ncbi:MAG: hypothetical protein H6709_23865 [Kofleriaceae bacterium]|nr:hypothetical protein [Kofleriaceae bacterium]MCB9575124.1 hypothetical protein [Kofleriaceae bacterium]